MLVWLGFNFSIVPSLMMAETHCLESCELIAPVTALEFVDTKLFIGEGPYLSIYETTNGNRVTIERIFHNQRIHCIKVSDMNSPTTIVVCGGKAVSVLNFQQCLSRRKLSVNRTTFLSDWIWDICLLNSPLEHGLQVALATGHNTVWLWNVKNDEKVQLSRCEEQCILYCARFIGRILDQMWLACGTVFNEVLLWKITNKKSNDESVRVSKRLTGHDGVIFSIRYDEGKQILCSVSDDRSIKVWRLVCSLEDSLKVTAEPFLVLFGHKARVWDCLIMKKYIVSIGEDSTCLVWNFDGEIIKKFKGHIGKSIWSLAAHQNEQIISTGGGDGGVRLLSLNDKEGNIQEQHSFSAIPQDESTSQTNWDIPRSLAFLPNNNVLVMTDKGNFYSYSCFQDVDKNSPTGTWEFLQNERDYCSYSLMALSPCRKIIALGNIYGNIKLWSAIDPSWSPLEMKPYNDKVLSLHWITGNEKENGMNLFSCGPDGCLIWWTINCLDESRDFVYEVKSYFRLPYCRQRWPNSIFVTPIEMCSETHDQFDASLPLVLCGDRRGSLHIFKADNKTEPMDPLHSHIGIHGRNGVTHITSNRGLVYTAGRDGCFRQYKFCGTNLELVNKQKVYKGLEWIERLNFTSESDLLVMGFHTVDFVTWSMQRNEILLRIPCGGGHRIWDLLITESETQAITMFTYLKKQTVHVHKFSEMKVSQTSILQDSFHGREATCVRFIRSLESGNQGEQFCLFATGSEDTNINITAYYPTRTQKRFRKLYTCQGHISSVRCLALMRVNHVPVSDEYNLLLFSGGGRAALKCWTVSLSNMVRNESSPVPLKLDKSSLSICTLLTELPQKVSRYRRKRLQRHVMEGSFCDIRIMSVSVFSLSDILPLDWCNASISSPVCGVITGCSDGHLRFYVMDSKIKNMKLIGHCSWNEKCLLCVGHFLVLLSIQHRLVVYAADTAGRISFWDFTDLFTDYFFNIIHDEQKTVSNESLPIKSELPVSGDEVNVEIGLDSSHSSIPLQRDCVESCLDAQSEGVCSTKPFYSRSLHQSGVNAVSLVPRDSGQYLLCSGGDDGALMVALFEIRGANGSLAIHSWREVSVPNAHTSSTTGVKILEDRFVLSASVDQRLKLWKIIIGEHSEMSIQLSENHFVDVADIQDIDVQRNRDGSYHIVVCGVGLQMLTLKKTYQ